MVCCIVPCCFLILKNYYILNVYKLSRFDNKVHTDPWKMHVTFRSFYVMCSALYGSKLRSGICLNKLNMYRLNFTNPKFEQFRNMRNQIYIFLITFCAVFARSYHVFIISCLTCDLMGSK